MKILENLEKNRSQYQCLINKLCVSSLTLSVASLCKTKSNKYSTYSAFTEPLFINKENLRSVTWQITEKNGLTLLEIVNNSELVIS